MPSLPRIITVDPSGNVARIARAAIDLSDALCRQIDVPTGEEALEEMTYSPSNLLISALNLEDMRAFELADSAREIKEDIAIVILADEDDPEMDMDMQREHGFVYLQRPLDINQFTSVMFAGMRGEDIFSALRKPAAGGGGGGAETMGPVPAINIEKAGDIIDQLVSELFAMSIVLIDRAGNVLLERGPSANYIDRDSLVSALLPSMRATIDMRDIVGGDATTLHFYDGDHRDVYTLSVGMHHMLCIAFDGEKGQREFGAVNRYGRKAAMDLIALLGAEAFFIRRVQAEPEEEVIPRRHKTTVETQAVAFEDEDVKLEPAEISFGGGGSDLEKVEMEAIADLDLSILDQLDSIDTNDADALFNLDNLEESGVSLKSKQTIDWNNAIDLGILGGNNLGDD